MKIERAVTAFEPITITLESQEDVNLLFNTALIANESGQCTDVEQNFTHELASVLEPHVVTEEELPSKE